MRSATAKTHVLSYDLALATARVMVVLLNATFWLLILHLMFGAKFHRTRQIAATSARRTLKWLACVCRHTSSMLTIALVFGLHSPQKT
jgi:hypothetical protein